MELLTKSAEETKGFGKKLAADLVIRNQPLVIALTGDLGSGKTTFTQGLLEGLGVKKRVLSPTFVLLRSYEVRRQKVKTVYHLDFYRLDEDASKEAINLGLPDLMKEKGNIVVIEWAEKVRALLPKNSLFIDFEYVDDVTRRIKVKGRR